jgi:hypothetical protein
MSARGRSSVGEHLLCKQGVAGSNPAVSTTPKPLPCKDFSVILLHR